MPQAYTPASLRTPTMHLPAIAPSRTTDLTPPHRPCPDRTPAESLPSTSAASDRPRNPPHDHVATIQLVPHIRLAIENQPPHDLVAIAPPTRPYANRPPTLTTPKHSTPQRALRRAPTLASLAPTSPTHSSPPPQRYETTLASSLRRHTLATTSAIAQPRSTSDFR
nr:early nodulin-75-like [Penaeus vannamei]